MIRSTVLAASLILAAGGAFAQDAPSYDNSAAAAARNLGATASPGYAYGTVRRAPARDVDTTGSIAIPRASEQKVMGLPVPGTY